MGHRQEGLHDLGGAAGGVVMDVVLGVQLGVKRVGQGPSIGVWTSFNQEFYEGYHGLDHKRSAHMAQAAANCHREVPKSGRWTVLSQCTRIASHTKSR